jgi:hypothetical protein
VSGQLRTHVASALSCCIVLCCVVYGAQEGEKSGAPGKENAAKWLAPAEERKLAAAAYKRVERWTKASRPGASDPASHANEACRAADAARPLLTASI